MTKKSKLSKLINNKSNNDYYVIAETAHNHGGDPEYLYRTINELIEIGVDAIKIHMNLNLSSYASKDFKEGDVYDKFIWDEKQYSRAIDQIKRSNKEVVVLANDVESLDYLMSRDDIDAIELHQVSLYDVHMINKLINYSGVVVLGIGGTELDEISRAIDLLNSKQEKDIVLIYGFQTFPSNPCDVNLEKMNKIKDLFGYETGYADHTSYDHPHNAFISSLGYATGSRVIEKHYTPEHGEKRIDYESAVGEQIFMQLIEYLNIIRDIKSNGSLQMSRDEESYGQYGVMKKAIVASRDLASGTKLKEQDILFKRTSIKSIGRQSDYNHMIGKIITKDVCEDDMIDFSLLKEE